MTRPEYAIVGLIRKAQGIRGEVVVEPLTDKPDVVFASGNRVFAGDAEGDLLRSRPGEDESLQTLTIESTKPFKGGLIVQFAELRDRNGAELWRGRHVLAPFAELPPPGEDEIYLHDLIGMKAERSTGEQIGAVTAYYELPQGIMLDVETATGSVLIPYRPEIVRSADVANRILVIEDTLGFLE
ncbi:MAG: 16S rRNA processing protein RimM [Gemmatimonadaceae bacterium]|nr:16S rRNA processing protein RimM [Gemmatimonadaceae bacterium]